MLCGLHPGRRASVTFRHALTWNVHTPSLAPSASQVGSPSMHACVLSGKPPAPFSVIAHSSPQPVFGRREAGTNTTFSAFTTWQVPSHGSPGLPFDAPSSHSSLQSMRPLPHTSLRHVEEQPSHDAVLPSSQSSPGSLVPLPHTATAAQGESVGVRTTCADGVIVEPDVIGGFVGSRFSKRFNPAGRDWTAPPTVSWPLAWSRFSPMAPSVRTTALLGIPRVQALITIIPAVAPVFVPLACECPSALMVSPSTSIEPPNEAPSARRVAVLASVTAFAKTMMSPPHPPDSSTVARMFAVRPISASNVPPQPSTPLPVPVTSPLCV